jgi:hypothetical protein
MIKKRLAGAILATAVCWSGLSAAALAAGPPIGQATMATEISCPSTVTVDTRAIPTYVPSPLTAEYLSSLTDRNGFTEFTGPLSAACWDYESGVLTFVGGTISKDVEFAPGESVYTITPWDWMPNSYLNEETLTFRTFYDDTLHASTFTGFSAVRPNALWRTPVRFTGRLARVDGQPITDRDDLQYEYDAFVQSRALGFRGNCNVRLQYSKDNVTWGTFGHDGESWTDIEPTGACIEPNSLEASAVVLDPADTWEEFVPKSGWYRLYFYRPFPDPHSNSMANGFGPSMHLTFAPEWGYKRAQVSALSLKRGRKLAIHQRLYPVQVTGQGKTTVQRRSGGKWRTYKTYRAARTKDMWERRYGKLFVTNGVKLPRGTYRARVTYVGSDYEHIVSAWSYTLKVR